MAPNRQGSSGVGSGNVRKVASGNRFGPVLSGFAPTLSSNSGNSNHKFSDLLRRAKKRNKKQLNTSTRRQVFCTLSATALILAVFIAVGATYAVTFVTTADALLQSGLEIRRRVARSINGELALTLRPVYASSMRLALRNSVDPGTAQGIWPLAPETIENDFDELLANVWVYLTSDLNLRRVNADGTGKEFVPFLGIAINIATSEDVRTPTTDLRGCGAVLQAGLFLGEGTGSGLLWVSDNPLKLAYRSVFSTDENGTRRSHIRWTSFHAEYVATINLTYAELPAPTCSQLPQMQVLAGGAPLGAADFHWSGPSPSDPYKGLEGIAPIRNGAGQPIGYVTSGLSVVFSINPLLNKILEEDLAWSRGATLAVISESGVLLGVSGAFTENVWMFNKSYVSEIPENSALGQAFGHLRRAAGNPCPAWHESSDEGDRLTDAVPFYAEDYGLPPMNERWCVIITFPRENLYAEIDNVWRIKIVSALCVSGLFLLATLLFLASLRAAVASDRDLCHESLKADARKVISAVKDVHRLNCPMALVSAADFLRLPKLEAHESMRDRGMLVVLDSLEEIESFKAANEIIFFSHQWLSFTFPDNTEGAQLEAIQGAIRAVQNNPSMVIRSAKSNASITDSEEEDDATRGIYIWCDYTSIAQKHSKMQQAAVESLPLYARMADKFIVIAPPVVHEDTLSLCDLESYTGRGWCRAEMLAKACGSGIRDMYFCVDKLGTLSPVTPTDLSTLPLNIFQGAFSHQADVVDLVNPILGLYSLVLRKGDLPHMQTIHSHIQRDKEKFFPETYCAGKEEVKLFGKYIELLELYVNQGHEALLHRPTSRQFQVASQFCHCLNRAQK